jgi:aryl-alcohol dehydrogenase-like predicted oxidoreductase
VNYTDGQSETILGNLLKAERSHFVVATKFSLTNPDSRDPNSGGNSQEDSFCAARGYLSRCVRSD